MYPFSVTLWSTRSTRTIMFVVYTCLIPSYLDPEPRLLLPELNERMAPRFKKLNKSCRHLFTYLCCLPNALYHNRTRLNWWMNLAWLALFHDLRKESSIRYVLAQIDNCIQHGEDVDVKIKDFDADDDET